MAESENLRTIKQLHKASGVSTGTIDRIRRGQISTGVDQLAALAKPFGLEPWQLLEPEIQVQRPTINKDDKDAALVAEAYKKMTPAERMRLDRLFAAAMDVPLVQQEVPRNLGGLSGLGDLDERSDAKKKRGA